MENLVHAYIVMGMNALTIYIPSSLLRLVQSNIYLLVQLRSGLLNASSPFPSELVFFSESPPPPSPFAGGDTPHVFAINKPETWSTSVEK